jgi:hypothetical protein
MTRWWKGAATAAAWLAMTVAAQAQQQIPSPVGAARMVEPLRYEPGPEPNLVPGPLTPQIAPPGPPDCLALPSDHSSAFQCENYTTESAFYGSFGGVGLVRYHPGNLAVATDQTGATALSMRDLQPPMRAGAELTVGYLFGNQAIELSGFFVGNAQDTREVNSPGAFNTAFTSSAVVPPQLAQTPAGPTVVTGPAAALTALGFGGMNGTGLFTAADQVREKYASQFGNAEANYRIWNSGVFAPELILGIRYASIRQQFGVSVDQGALTNAPDPGNAATYTSTTQNNILAMQIGTEFSIPCPLPYCGWIWFSGMGKAGFGPNFVERDSVLQRGDGYEPFSYHHNSVQVGQLYEIAGFVDLHLAERIRLRAGYRALWAVGISNPGYQLNYDFNAQGTRGAEQGSGLWHGPVGEIEFLW